ncbi:MAG TPA: hypothetical protein VEL09_11760 [Burkholderiales bacterium]|nr:hypothetical protein [Burkholderiales bacterium]
MKGSGSAAFAAASILIAGPASAHEDMKGMEMPMKQMEKAPGTSALKPAEGASVKIVSPKPGQVVKDDRVPLEFRWAKGKRGHHSHVYVDGKLRSMFEGSRATLTGIEPGQHTLELRVVAADHQTEAAALRPIV